MALEQLIEIVEGVGAGCYGTKLLQEYLLKFVLDEIPIGLGSIMQSRNGGCPYGGKD